MSSARTVLIVDGDIDRMATLAEQLTMHDQFEACVARSAGEAMSSVQTRAPGLVIMSVTLPDMDGKDAVRAMRAAGFSNPIIMLTGPQDADMLLSLEAGANDCVAMPFRFAVLLARIRAHLRPHQDNDDAALQIGGYLFRPSAKQLINEAGDKLRLTEKETDILRFLHRAGGRTVPRDVLLREVWAYNAGVTTHTLETHIYRLRQKMESDPANARILMSETGGYKLVG